MTVEAGSVFGFTDIRMTLSFVASKEQEISAFKFDSKPVQTKVSALIIALC